MKTLLLLVFYIPLMAVSHAQECSHSFSEEEAKKVLEKIQERSKTSAVVKFVSTSPCSQESFFEVSAEELKNAKLVKKGKNEASIQLNFEELTPESLIERSSNSGIYESIIPRNNCPTSQITASPSEIKRMGESNFDFKLASEVFCDCQKDLFETLKKSLTKNENPTKIRNLSLQKSFSPQALSQSYFKRIFEYAFTYSEMVNGAWVEKIKSFKLQERTMFSKNASPLMDLNLSKGTTTVVAELDGKEVSKTCRLYDDPNVDRMIGKDIFKDSEIILNLGTKAISQ